MQPAATGVSPLRGRCFLAFIAAGFQVDSIQRSPANRAGRKRFMFSFFLPRYVKEGKAFLKNARKLLHYKRDLLSEAAVADFETQMEKLAKALRDRDRATAEAEAG